VHGILAISIRRIQTSEVFVVLAPNDKRLKVSLVTITAVFASWLTVACASEDSTADNSGTNNTVDYWGGTFQPPAVAPTVNFHAADTASACMTCHGPTGTAVTKLVYGGVVYQVDGVTPAPNVQVGVSDGVYKSVVYSAANGMYWAVGTNTVNWPVADIRIRTATGEAAKLATDARTADCDSCHHAGTTYPLKAP
jgi:cytochrome c553